MTYMDAVERHRYSLISEARAIHREHPDERIVGIVVEADAPEAPALRRTLPRDRRAATGSFWAMLTRESALNLLGAATPGLLDWIDDDGPIRKLPVIHAAARGMRTTSFEYAAEE